MLLIGVAAAAVAQQDVQTISNFRIPDYDDEMNLKSILYGGFATFKTSTGFVNIKELKVEYFDKGEVDMRISAPQCIFDRRNKRAKSGGSIRISREDMIVTGEDYGFDQTQESFIIKKNVKVVLKNLRKAERVSGEQDDAKE